MTRIPLVAVMSTLLLLPSIATAGEKSQSYNVKKGGQLEVRAEAGGTITVRGWDKDEVFVRVSSINEEQLKGVTISQGGGKVLVEFRGNHHNVKDMRFDINVP